MVEFPAGVDAANWSQLSGGVISELDRCFRYGDGLFETILFVDQEPVLFDEHISRLRRGARALALNYSVESAPLLARCRAVIHADQNSDASQNVVVRLQVSRGEGGRGYAPPVPPAPVREVISCHLPPKIPSVLKLRMLDTRLMISRLLCGIKHCSRLEQVLAANELLVTNDVDGEDCWEGVMHDEFGFLTEGTRSNIIVESNGRLLTPLLDRSGLRSTLLEALVALDDRDPDSVLATRMRLDQSGGLHILDPEYNKAFLPVDQLPASAWTSCVLAGMAVCNSVMGLRAVNALAGVDLPLSPKIAHLAVQLNKRLGYA
ncbi:aminotransferase class IV [Allohahella marinimesophila]|uniref:branched-chain-amino-acid transaminase n=1 Tax=Allohahella marinimesophila TaxID=1054972 RepID=A0ABP7NPW7_9GAMM